MIKFIRESLWFKAVALFLAIAILTLACSQPEIVPTNRMDNSLEIRNFHEFPRGYDIAGDFTKALQVVNAAVKYNNIASMHELNNEFFEDNEFTQAMENEVNKYSQLGFESYLDDIVNRNIVPIEFKNEMLNLEIELSDFIIGQHPNVDQFTDFLTSKHEMVNNSNISENTKYLLNTYLDLALGAGNYFYQQIPNSNDGLSLREDCEKWQALLCSTLSIVVGTVAGTATFVLLTLADVEIVLITGGVATPVATADLNLFALIGIAVGFYSGMEFYDWCCSWFGQDDENNQECSFPTGYYIKKLDCNLFKITIFGESEYGATAWNNTNTEPSQITTQTPKLVFSVVEPQDECEFVADITCIEDPANIDIFHYVSPVQLLEVDEGEFDLAWVETPPEEIQFQVISTPEGIDTTSVSLVKVNTPGNSNVYDYDWTITPPSYFIIGGGSKDNFAQILFAAPGTTATTTVTVTNTCTGQTETLSVQTIINQ